MLGATVHPYVKDVPGPQVARVSRLLHQTTTQIIHWERALPRAAQRNRGQPVLLCSDCSMMAGAGPRKIPVASGHLGKQKWSLILQAVQGSLSSTRGGFVPIFWNAPYSYIHASTDIGEVENWITDKFLVHKKVNLAVLDNGNKIVNAFTNMERVQAQVCDI